MSYHTPSSAFSPGGSSDNGLGRSSRASSTSAGDSFNERPLVQLAINPAQNGYQHNPWASESAKLLQSLEKLLHPSQQWEGECMRLGAWSRQRDGSARVARAELRRDGGRQVGGQDV